MAAIHQLNRALLHTLMSAETANIVADRLEELEREKDRLRKFILATHGVRVLAEVSQPTEPT